ncbi:major capsid protein [Ectothiorhodospira shaposhnikovii]|uniref:major capsid protein n=1 Tax=Ectothiorhodospira shaposhnikovii TaxID=1054 RepID=UPI001EE8179C|nr:phage major capsid protein [Ectothiorhodospira shaposhnikovii]MCG5512852.1 phage major capsid protein [Ectothiorhodospira shaposhnikovii]
MPLLKEEAAKLSNNDLVAGVIEEVIDKEDLLAVLPFTETKGKAYVYNRENFISEAVFLDPNEVVPEEASTFEEVVARLRILIGDVDVDKFLNTTMDDTNNQKAIQIAQKAKGIARKFRRTLANGNASVNAKEFDGVHRLVTANQTISAGTNGNALTLSMLDELLDAVPNGADVLMMRSGTIRAYRALLRASGGLEPAHVMMENFGRPMLTHNGVPIIVNDFLPSNEVQGSSSATASIYAMRLNEVDGLHGIFGGGNAGFVVEDIGTVQNKDATRTRVKWYCGLALKSTRSLARVRGVTNV